MWWDDHRVTIWTGPLRMDSTTVITMATNRSNILRTTRYNIQWMATIHSQWGQVEDMVWTIRSTMDTITIHRPPLMLDEDLQQILQVPPRCPRRVHLRVLIGAKWAPLLECCCMEIDDHHLNTGTIIKDHRCLVNTIWTVMVAIMVMNHITLNSSQCPTVVSDNTRAPYLWWAMEWILYTIHTILNPLIQGWECILHTDLILNRQEDSLTIQVWSMDIKDSIHPSLIATSLLLILFLLFLLQTLGLDLLFN